MRLPSKSITKKTRLNRVLQRSPVQADLQKQLARSQHIISVLQPAWLNWLADYMPENLIKECTLSHLIDKQVFIYCQSAASATRIKHFSPSILKLLRESLIADAGLKKSRHKVAQIEKINISVWHPVKNQLEQAQKKQRPDQFDQKGLESIAYLKSIMKR